MAVYDKMVVKPQTATLNKLKAAKSPISNTTPTPTVPSGGSSTPSFQTQGNIYTGTPMIQDRMKELENVQNAKAIADLNKAKNTSLSNLNAEQVKIAPMYQQSKMNANTQSQMGARNFSEFMAQRGLSSSGVAAQGEINRMGAYQRNINDLNVAENNANADIARRVSDVNNGYQSDLASAQAGIRAQGLQNYINQANTDRTFNRNTMESDRNYNNIQLPTTQLNLKQGNLDYQKGLYDYNDMVNPNSVSNQLKQAQLSSVLQGIQEGKIKLEYLPKTMQEELNQMLLNNTNQAITNQYLPSSLALENTGRSLGNNAQIIENKYKPLLYQADLNNTASQIADRANSSAKYSFKDDPLFSQSFNTYKSLSVSEAVKALTEDGQDLIARFGPDGYAKLKDLVLEDAKTAGQLKPLSAADQYYKALVNKME